MSSHVCIIRRQKIPKKHRNSLTNQSKSILVQNKRKSTHFHIIRLCWIHTQCPSAIFAYMKAKSVLRYTKYINIYWKCYWTLSNWLAKTSMSFSCDWSHRLWWKFLRFAWNITINITGQMNRIRRKVINIDLLVYKSERKISKDSKYNRLKLNIEISSINVMEKENSSSHNRHTPFLRFRFYFINIDNQCWCFFFSAHKNRSFKNRWRNADVSISLASGK